MSAAPMKSTSGTCRCWQSVRVQGEGSRIHLEGRSFIRRWAGAACAGTWFRLRSNGFDRFSSGRRPASLLTRVPGEGAIPYPAHRKTTRTWSLWHHGADAETIRSAVDAGARAVHVARMADMIHRHHTLVAVLRRALTGFSSAMGITCRWTSAVCLRQGVERFSYKRRCSSGRHAPGGVRVLRAEGSSGERCRLHRKGPTRRPARRATCLTA